MKPDLTRRNFLKVPAAAVTAPAILSAQAPSDVLRVAFVGAGNRGSYLLKHMLQVPGVQVVAVCDLIPERASQAAATVAEAGGGKAETYTDFRKMLDERKDLDAVVSATYDYTHRDVYTSVLEVGKHLYGEKPLALTPQDCKMVVSAAKTAKGIMQVGFQLRFDPKIHAAENFILGGGIGKVLMCHGIRHGGDLPRNIPWYFDREKCGDMVVDQGIHILDLFTWAIGTNPLRVMASGGINLFVDDPPGRTTMDNYSVLFDYPGSRVNFSHHYFDPPGFSGHQMLVFGSSGAVNLGRATWQPRDKRGPQIQIEVADEGKDSTYLSLAAFVDNARNNRQPPINDVESAMRSTLVPLMATKAIYEQRVVTWEEMGG